MSTIDSVCRHKNIRLAECQDMTQAYSSLCAIAIKYNGADTLFSAPFPPFQNFWVRHQNNSAVWTV